MAMLFFDLILLITRACDIRVHRAGSQLKITKSTAWERFNCAILVLASLFIISVNASVMYWLVNKTRTLVDKMILVDCAANIGGLVNSVVAIVCWYCQFANAVPEFCMFKHIVRFFFMILNKVVPLTIATYM